MELACLSWLEQHLFGMVEAKAAVGALKWNPPPSRIEELDLDFILAPAIKRAVAEARISSDPHRCLPGISQRELERDIRRGWDLFQPEPNSGQVGQRLDRW
jgi:hypothetical protein